MRNIDLIIIHCSASDIAAHDNIETIRKWHVDERGWSDIGYQYVIPKSGEICEGRPVSRSGAHCQGHNANSIGICFTGDKVFSPRQFESGIILVSELLAEFSLRPIDVLAHHELNSNKTCPNFDIYDKIVRYLGSE